MAFTTENTADVTQRVFPTFPVVIGWGRGSAMRNVGSFNPALLVHGEEGITLDDFVLFQKALFVDMVYLQQDAFDDVDAATPMDRQRLCFNKVYALVTQECDFDDKEAAREYFTRLTGLFKNLNYTRRDSPGFADLEQQIESLAESVRVAIPAEPVTAG